MYDSITDESRKNFGEIINNKRKDMKLPLKTIAIYCGVSLNFISLIERGVKSPSDRVIIKLSEILEIEAPTLFKILDKIPPSVKKNVNTSIYEHEGIMELFNDLFERVTEQELRNELYGELYDVYVDFLKRKNLHPDYV